MRMFAADSCIGDYDLTTDCLNTESPSYPCAFANIDLTGTPITLVREKENGAEILISNHIYIL